MNINSYDEFDQEHEDFNESTPIIPEVSPSTKLERRRKIEDLLEEKKLKEELADYI